MTDAVNTRGICLMDGGVAGLGVTSVRIMRDRIVDLGSSPMPGDLVIQLNGARVLPGLINAHDHLQLNNFPRTKYRSSYHNAAEWIDDVEAHRETDRRFLDGSAVDRKSRLWIGGLKNLFSGTTTVVHHDPFYQSLDDPNFPVRVLSDYRWSHSLGLDGSRNVRNVFLNTPGDQLWFIHAGEGVDKSAASEFDELVELKCVGPRTRIVHGVAFDAQARRHLAASGAGLIWCPSSNIFLFGQTAEVGELVKLERVALGSDSRLTGERDLLAEIRFAHQQNFISAESIEALVTISAAAVLQLHDRGKIAVNQLADILIIPPGRRLWELERADIRCVMRGGRMLYGDRLLAEAMLPASGYEEILVDGRSKVIASTIIDELRAAKTFEDGVRWPSAAWNAA